MDLSTPAALGLGLLALLILALHWLRPRQRSRPVASVTIWRQLAAEAAAGRLARGRRPASSPLLWLQLLALAALVLALARPWREAPVAVAPQLILLLDRSLSMAAEDAVGEGFDIAAGGDADSSLDWLPGRAASRFDDARAALLRRARAAEGSRLSLIAFDQRAELLVVGSQDPDAIAAALDDLEIRARPGQAGDALLLADSLARSAAGARVVLFSDGNFSLEGAPPVDLAVELVRFGGSDDNQSLAALDLDPERGELFLRVTNAAGRSVTRRVETRVDGALLDARDLRLPAGGQASARLSLPAGAKQVEAQLTGSDALPLDDRAWALAESRTRVRVGLSGPGFRALETALDLMPEVASWARVDEPPYDTAEGPAELLILDGQVPDGVDRPALLLAPPADLGQGIERVTVQGRLERPAPRTLDAGQHLLAGTAFETVIIERALALELGAAWTPLVVAEVEDRTWPLMAEGRLDGRPVLLLAFDPRDSDLPLRPAFPLWLAAAVEHLTPVAPGHLPARLTPGEPLRLDLASASAAEGLRLIDPAGDRHAPAVEGGRAVFDQTWQPGIYRLEGIGADTVEDEGRAAGISGDESEPGPVAQTASEPERFVVSLADGGVRSIRPRDLPPEIPAAPTFAEAETGSPEDASVPAANVRRGRLPLWPSLAWAAVVLLLIEWAWDHRRALPWPPAIAGRRDARAPGPRGGR